MITYFSWRRATEAGHYSDDASERREGAQVEAFLDEGYDGPSLRHDRLSKCADAYYRSLVHIEPGANVTNVGLYNVSFGKDFTCEEAGSDSDSGAW